MNDQIKNAVTVLKQGGIIIFPTDTAFGIGCRMDNVEAIARLFSIRKRPLSKAPPVLVSSMEMAKEIANVETEVEEKLLRPYWPGALTVIMPVKKSCSSLLVQDGGIGLRMPNHETPLSLIDGVGVGILGMSANFAGGATPYTYQDLDPLLIKQADAVLAGECSRRRESTVISTLTIPWKVLRQGAVDLKLEVRS